MWRFAELNFSALVQIIIVVASFIQDGSAFEPSLPLPIRDIHQFSNPSYIQEVLVRSNGDLLVSTVWPNATIYSVENPGSDNPIVSLVLTAEGINAIPSMVEIRPDVFYCLGGMIAVPGAGIWGTFSVWELDLRSHNKLKKSQTGLRQLTTFPNNGLPAALVPIPGVPNKVLVADSQLGIIMRVDVVTGEKETIIKDKSMEPPAWAPLPAGMIQIILHKGYLYYSLIFEALLYRIRLTEDGYLYPGAVGELVAPVHAVSVDKFTIGPEGYDDLWAATDADNRLVHVSPDGNVTFVAGAPDEKTLLGSVAAAFGKAPGEEKILYVGTCGGFDNPLEGSVTEGGKLVAIDTSAFYGESSNKAHPAAPTATSNSRIFGGKGRMQTVAPSESSSFIFSLMEFFVNYMRGQ